MAEKFRFAIVGTGNISTAYINACRKLDGIEITAAVSRSGKMPQAIDKTENFELAPTLKDIKGDFDGVIIATPNGLHHQPAVEAASMGKHVLTEKPLDISIEAMDSMLAACRKNNVKLGVTYQKRFRPDNIIMKKFISENKLGRILAANLNAFFFRDDNYYNSAAWRGTRAIDGGGPFIQQACHEIDIYGWFFGKPVKVASSLSTFMHDIEVEDYGTAILKHENGMIGTITASTVSWPGYVSTLTVHTEKGTVIMQNDAIQTWNIKDMPDPRDLSDDPSKIHSGAGSAHVEETSGHEAVIKDFVNAVMRNAEPSVSGDAARLATGIILDIYNNNSI